MKPGLALRAAIGDLIVPAPAATPGPVSAPEPTFADLLEQYGSTSDIAAAAGFAGGAKGSADYKARRTFMRSLQRWANFEQGTGKQSRRPAGLPSLVRRINEAASPVGPYTIAGVLDAIEGDGVTVVGFTAKVKVSDDERWRTVPNVFIPSDVLDEAGFFEPARAGDWAEAAFAFCEAWASDDGYGIGHVISVDEIEEIILRIGR